MFVGPWVRVGWELSKVCRSVGQSRMGSVRSLLVRRSELDGSDKMKKYTRIGSRYGRHIGLGRSGNYISSPSLFCCSFISYGR